MCWSSGIALSRRHRVSRPRDSKDQVRAARSASLQVERYAVVLPRPTDRNDGRGRPRPRNAAGNRVAQVVEPEPADVRSRRCNAGASACGRSRPVRVEVVIRRWSEASRRLLCWWVPDRGRTRQERRPGLQWHQWTRRDRLVLDGGVGDMGLRQAWSLSIRAFGIPRLRPVHRHGADRRRGRRQRVVVVGW